MDNNQQQCPSFPRINEPAPPSRPRRRSDLAASRTIVASGSSCSRTPPTSRRCTTEFMGFARAADTFRSMNCELLGLSIDSLFSHLAWTRSIKQNFGVEITFPIIEDLKMEVARAYGMIHPGAGDTSAVRATFFIDPEGKLRAMVHYPMSNGRSIDEFVRLLQALQTSDANGVATPENWKPGEAVIVPPPKTAEAPRNAHRKATTTSIGISRRRPCSSSMRPRSGERIAAALQSTHRDPPPKNITSGRSTHEQRKPHRPHRHPGPAG